MLKHFIKTIIATAFVFLVVSLTALLIYSFFSNQKIDTGQGDGTILIGAFITYALPIFKVLFLLLLLVADYFALKYWYKTFSSSGSAT